MMFALASLLFVNSAAVESALRAGLTALNNNDLATAQKQLESATRLDPRKAAAWIGLAQTYLKQHKQDAADRAASRAGSLHPEDPKIQHALAMFYSETGNFTKAGECEARYAQKTPQDADALPRAAALYLSANQPEPAIELARQALGRQDRVELHELLGKAYLAAGKVDPSIAEWQTAIRLRPYEERLYFSLAQELLQLQKFQGALDTLGAGLKVFDKSAQLQLARGVALYGLRRFPEAIEAFLLTIQLAPEVEQPYVFLGRMLDVAESKLPAVTQGLAAYCKSQPNNPMSSLLYAKALGAGLGDPARIEALLRQSIRLNDALWESHFELGLILERRRNFEEAARELERSVQLNPDEPTPHYRLARVYDRLGRTAEAVEQRALHEHLSQKAK